LAKIRVLVVDDSTFMRQVISDILESDLEIEVIGTARNGQDALKKVEELRPDVVTLDIQMPKMDGLEALSHIMDAFPTPVVMLSAMDKKEADVVIRALELGAVDFVSKPKGKTTTLLDDKTGAELIEKVKIAAGVDVRQLEPLPLKKSYTVEPPKFAMPQFTVITIGASTGGPKALIEVLSNLPKNIPAAFLIVQHMPLGFTKSFAERLNEVCELDVDEAKNGDEIKPGRVFIAPGGYHMTVEKEATLFSDGVIRLVRSPKVNKVRPSVDVTMTSVAEVYGPNSLGILLTGMGVDGARGMRAIKEKNGRTIAEDESSCVIFGMPRAAIEMDCVDKIAPLSRIPTIIIKMLT
jgi:two-component system chemotaxis response regulator CheB